MAFGAYRQVFVVPELSSDIHGLRYCFKMVRVCASTVPAKVVYLKTFRYLTFENPVRKPMCGRNLSVIGIPVDVTTD